MKKDYLNMTKKEVNEELLSAVIEGDLDMIIYLVTSPELKNNADTYCRTSSDRGDIPSFCDIFMLAAFKGHLDIIKFLIKENVFYNIDAKNIKGENALMMACKAGKVDIVEYFLNSGKDFDINTKNDIDHNLLMVACLNNDIEMVKLLLSLSKEKGLDLFHETRSGDNFLMRACTYSSSELIKYLFAHPIITPSLINYRNKNKGSMNSLDIICATQEKPLLEYLLKNNKFELNKENIKSAFDSAVRGNNASVVKYFIENKVMNNHIDIYEKDKNDESILLKACMFNANKVVDYFLIDLNMKVDENTINILEEKNEKDFFKERYQYALELIKKRDLYNKIDNTILNSKKSSNKVKV